MGTVAAPDRPDAPGRSRSALQLYNGDRMDQRTFHALYEAAPEGVKAELIGGTVYIMASPVSRRHGKPLCLVLRWLGAYAEASPGVEGFTEETLILGPENEPQPDAGLRLLPSHGGRTTDQSGYIQGPPELVLEVATSTAACDLHQKKEACERAGVEEYLVAMPEEVRWFRLEEGRYVPLREDADGVMRSRRFPGLWLDPEALLAGSRDGVIDAVRRGIAGREAGRTGS